jgi:hypothetical protein
MINSWDENRSIKIKNKEWNMNKWEAFETFSRGIFEI